MWVFLTARLRQWVILAVLVPLVSTLVHLLRTRLEARSGSTRFTRALASLENLGRRNSRRGRRGRQD
jgi:hypothetical protein